MSDDEPVPLFTVAGLSGLLACCVGVPLLGGTAFISGVAAGFGLTTGVTYVAVAGVTGLLGAGATYAYRRYRRPTSA